MSIQAREKPRNERNGFKQGKGEEKDGGPSIKPKAGKRVGRQQNQGEGRKKQV